MNDGTAAAGPRIERVNAKIGTLERRAEWLRKRLGESGRNERQESFDRSEVEALEAACAALRFHRVSLDAETDPALALSELVDAQEHLALVQAGGGGRADTDAALHRLDAAQTRARRILKELDPD